MKTDIVGINYENFKYNYSLKVIFNKLKMEVKIIEDFYVFNCPQCNEEIIVFKDELNCRIFRHAVYKHNYQQVNPHLSKVECDKLIETDSVYGCCKPFEIVYQNNKFLAIKCEYK